MMTLEAPHDLHFTMSPPHSMIIIWITITIIIVITSPFNCEIPVKLAEKETIDDSSA